MNRYHSPDTFESIPTYYIIQGPSNQEVFDQPLKTAAHKKTKQKETSHLVSN